MSQQFAKIVPYDALPDVAWKNGRGTTRELLVYPAVVAAKGSGAQVSLGTPKEHPWRIRISVATIQEDSAFSSFENTKRIFAVLEGGGVTLKVDGTSYQVTPDSPALVFSGSSETSCQLIQGKTLDLNLMLRGEDGFMQFFDCPAELGEGDPCPSSLVGKQAIALKHLAVFSLTDGFRLSINNPHGSSALPAYENNQAALFERSSFQKYTLVWFETPPAQISVVGKGWLIGIYPKTTYAP